MCNKSLRSITSFTFIVKNWHSRVKSAKQLNRCVSFGEYFAMINAMAKHKQHRPRFRLVHLGSFFILLIGLVAYQFSYDAPELSGLPLKALAAKHNVDLGVLVYEHRLNSDVYASMVREQFGLVTIDGGAHFKELRPSKDSYDFRKADKLVAYAEAHNMPVQLHHLVWGDEVMLPRWLLEGGYSREQLLEILKDHITTVVGRYKGRVREYSVVNEAFTESQHVFGLHSWWEQQLGGDPKLLDNYFYWANQADPKSKLILNDFNNETKNKVSDAMFNYVKAAKARGVPIDGIGMQMHVDAAKPPQVADLVSNMNRFAGLGVATYITEFDVNMNYVKGSAAHKDQKEADVADNVVEACIAAERCTSFTVFGLTTKNNLLKTLTRARARNVLFDSRYRPRPLYDEFRGSWQ